MGAGFRIAEGYIQVTADRSAADRTIDRWIRDVNGRLHDERGRFRSEGELHGQQYGDGVHRGFNRSRFRQIFDDILGGARRIGKAFLTIAKPVAIFALLMSKLSALGLIIGAVATGIVGLAAACAKLLPVIAQLAQVATVAARSLLILPGALATLLIPLLTVKLALSGVSKAFSALAKGDMEKFNEAMKKLAPNAQAFMKVVKEMWRVLDQIRLDAQNAFFKGLAAQLRGLAEITIPAVHAGLIRVAEAINSVLVQALLQLRTPQAIEQLDLLFLAIQKTLSNLAPYMAQIVQAFLGLVTAGAQVVAVLSGGAIDAVGRWADSINRMAAAGSLRPMLEESFGFLIQIKDLLVDIGGVIKGVFSAAGAAKNGGIFGFFERLHQLVDDNAGSITRFFENLGTVGQQLAPVWSALIDGLAMLSGAFADIATAFAPGLTTLFQALGPALASLAPAIIALAPALVAIASGLQPLADIISGLVIGFAPGFTALIQGLADGLAYLVPVAEPVGKALGDLVTALAPLLPLIGSLAADVLGVLAYEISALATVLGPTIKLFAEGFAQALSLLLPVALQAAQVILPLLAQAGVQIAQAFAPLIPVLIQIAMQVVQVLLPFIPQLAAVLAQMLPVVAQLAVQFGQGLLMALMALGPYIPQLVQYSFELIMAFYQLFLAIAPVLPQLMQLAVMLLDAWLKSGSFQLGMEMLIAVIQGAIGCMYIIVAVVQTVISIFGAAKSAVSGLVGGIQSGFSTALAVIRGLPSAITGALGNLGGLLVDAGKRLIQGLIDGIGAMLGALRSKLAAVTSLIPDWKGPEDKDRQLLYPAGRAIMGGLERGIGSRLPQLRNVLNDVTATVTANAAPAGALAGGGGATYHFAPGSITLDASKIRSIADLLELLDALQVTARKHGSSR